MTEDVLLSLVLRPTEAGKLAKAIARKIWGGVVEIREAPALADRAEAWPDPARLAAGDRVVLQVDATDDARRRYVRWLSLAARSLPERTSVAPFSSTPGGLHQLWCIAAARIRLPEHVRVEARHDLMGTRLAQIALGFGADTLAGPLQPERALPLAGVPRPNETTRTGLAHLITQTGLTPS